MASDTLGSSWHPAFRPNSHTDIPVPERSTAEPPRIPETAPAIEQAHSYEIKDTSSHGIPQEPATIEAPSTNDAAFLDQFADDDPEAGGWDLEDHNLSSTSATQADQKIGADAGAVDENPVFAPEAPAQTKAAKHSSTVSFARTVPHEMNWNDEDDAEWNLQRSDTDPFKFMPPNERTNSFPAVPPVESNPEDLLEQLQPPPASQAEEIMQEIELEDQQSDWTHQPDFLKTFDDANELDQQGSITFPVGGDLIGSQEAASTARFEEGLPLIPQNESEQGSAVEAPGSSGLGASFDDEAEGDDFFNQVQVSERQEAEEFDVSPALQRKDTSVFTTISAEATAFEPATPTVHESDELQYGHSAGANALTIGEAASAPAEADDSNASVPTGLDAKWAAAFGEVEDEDDFLLEDSAEEEKDLDPAAFFGSDDEGFLEDDVEDELTAASTQFPTPATAQAPNPTVNGRYTPAALPIPTQPVLNTFNSTPNIPQAQEAVPPQYISRGTTAFAAPLLKPDATRAQSFADKSKGGYASPYDLPMDVVRAPRLAQRTSMQQLPRANLAPSAPPTGPTRSISMYAQPPPISGVPASIPSPPSSSGSNQPPVGLRPAAKLSAKSSFFEDLPTSSKPRTVSRQNSLASLQQPPYGQPQGPSGLTMTSPTTQPPPAGIAGLVAPERSSPYSQLQNAPPRTEVAASSRYSPAPIQGPASNSMTPPVVATNRYSPAPPSRSNSGHYPIVPPPILAHQPRTSSPLAQFVSQDPSQNKVANISGGQVPQLARNSSSQYEPRLTRVPSLPPTREVEEEGPSPLLQSPPPIATTSHYSPQQSRRTPPPAGSPAMSTLSPPKRPASNYAPVSQSAKATREVSFGPPPRSQTQSPGTLYGRGPAKSADSAARPSSAHGPTTPRQVHPPVTRARGMSQVLNLVPPTDGRELDPLQRWRGAPSISWGFGGAMVTSFPKDIPRYGMNQALPTILRSPGEVKLQHIKDVQPLEDRLTKFSGPLKGKSKRKEAVAWLSQGIESLEKVLPNIAFQQNVNHEDKRAIERVLLWKILRILIENDGVLEGNPNVEKAVRNVLSPELDSSCDESGSPAVTMADLQATPSGVSSLQTDAVDSGTVEQIRKHLLAGDREKAAWAAVDRRLWGHAMLISSTVPGDLYKQVTQEFVKKEVNQAGGSNESLATLYGVLSGNHEESVDALVPSHARAGMQLISTSVTSGQSADALAGLDKWRETLGLILSNRSNNDIVAITSLGNLLSSYGRAEAAHICFLFARKHAVFGGLDDSKANFVLVGADHLRQAESFAKETEAVLLSEVYEFGLALSGSNTQQSCPHLAAYKLQHAMTLAEYGSRDKALAYCEAIMSTITAQTKRSPYYHPILMSAVDDLMGRLKLAPKDGSTSWISKPTMNQVSSSVWDKFNKFVSGDDAQNPAPGSPGEPGAESGPFARIAGGTPTISRSPSINNFETFGGPSPALPPTNRTSSRYAPISGQPSSSYDASSAYAPRTSMERSSGEYQRGSLELPRPAQESLPPMYGGPSVEGISTATFGHQPVATGTSQPLYALNSVAATTSTLPRSASSYSPYQRADADAEESQKSSISPHQPAASVNTSYSSYQSGLAQEPLQSNEAQPYETKPEIAVHDAPSDVGYQPLSFGGYEPPTPPTINTFDSSVDRSEHAPTTDTTETLSEEAISGGGWAAPSYQPYSYEPPTSSYEPDPEDAQPGSEESKPKKKSFMDDDNEDEFSTAKPAASAISQEKSKSEKDRENEEMFRKIAEDEAKRVAADKGQKKSGWLGGWFGGAKKEAEMPANKPIRAKLGETSSFTYDPEQKRWVNKKSGVEDTIAKSATPPPPRAASRNGTPPPPGSSSSALPMGAGTPPPPAGRPPMGMPRNVSNLSKMASMDSLTPPGPALGGTPPMVRSTSNMSNISNGSADSNGFPTLAPPTGLGNAPLSRPSTGLSNASSIDDLIGAAGPRKAGGKKPRKTGRYIDVMAK